MKTVVMPDGREYRVVWETDRPVSWEHVVFIESLENMSTSSKIIMQDQTRTTVLEYDSQTHYMVQETSFSVKDWAEIVDELQEVKVGG